MATPSDDELEKHRKTRTMAKRYETQGKPRLAEAWALAAAHHLEEAKRPRSIELGGHQPQKEA